MEAFDGVLLVNSLKDLADQDAFLAATLFVVESMHAWRSSKAMNDVLHVVASIQRKIA